MDQLNEVDPGEEKSDRARQVPVAMKELPTPEVPGGFVGGIHKLDGSTLIKKLPGYCHFYICMNTLY